MTSPTPAPGWYHAEGDAPATHRYWDRSAWVGGPVAVAPALGSRDSLPELGLVLGDPWARIGARVIDGIITAILGFVFTVPILIQRIRDQDNGSFDGLSGLRLGLDQYRDPALFAVLVVGLLFSAAYEIGFVAWKGGTPGKLAVGLRVVSVEGASPPPFERAAFRWSPALLGALPLLGWLPQILSLIFIFSDSRRRSLHDRAGRTYVVRR